MTISENIDQNHHKDTVQEEPVGKGHDVTGSLGEEILMTIMMEIVSEALIQMEVQLKTNPNTQRWRQVNGIWSHDCLCMVQVTKFLTQKVLTCTKIDVVPMAKTKKVDQGHG